MGGGRRVWGCHRAWGMSQGFGDTLTAPKSPKPSGLIFDIWPPKVVPAESVRLGCYFFYLTNFG